LTLSRGKRKAYSTRWKGGDVWGRNVACLTVTAEIEQKTTEERKKREEGEGKRPCSAPSSG